LASAGLTAYSTGLISFSSCFFFGGADLAASAFGLFLD